MNGRVVGLFAFVCLLVPGVGCKKDTAGSVSSKNPRYGDFSVKILPVIGIFVSLLL